MSTAALVAILRRRRVSDAGASPEPENLWGLSDDGEGGVLDELSLTPEYGFVVVGDELQDELSPYYTHLMDEEVGDDLVAVDGKVAVFGFATGVPDDLSVAPTLGFVVIDGVLQDDLSEDYTHLFDAGIGDDLVEAP